MGKRVSFLSCEQCGSEFTAKRSDAKFCSNTCKQYSFLLKDSPKRTFIFTEEDKYKPENFKDFIHETAYYHLSAIHYVFTNNTELPKDDIKTYYNFLPKIESNRMFKMFLAYYKFYFLMQDVHLHLSSFLSQNESAKRRVYIKVGLTNELIEQLENYVKCKSYKDEYFIGI